MTIEQLSEQLREYHGDVKQRLDALEIALHGEPGNEYSPGLHVQVQTLLGFRERVRFGVGAAWALLLTLVTVVWNRK